MLPAVQARFCSDLPALFLSTLPLAARQSTQQNVEAVSNRGVHEPEVHAKDEDSDNHYHRGRLNFLAARGRNLFHFRADVDIKRLYPLWPRLYLASEPLVGGCD